MGSLQPLLSCSWDRGLGVQVSTPGLPFILIWPSLILCLSGSLSLSISRSLSLIFRFSFSHIVCRPFLFVCPSLALCVCGGGLASASLCLPISDSFSLALLCVRCLICVLCVGPSLSVWLPHVSQPLTCKLRSLPVCLEVAGRSALCSVGRSCKAAVLSSAG